MSYVIKHVSSASRCNLFAACAPGIEPILLQELKEIHAARPVPLQGGVGFEGSLETVFRANMRLATANRILLRLAEKHVTDLGVLKRWAASLPWTAFVATGGTIPIHIRTTCYKSKIYHSAAAGQRIAEAMGDSLQRSALPNYRTAPKNEHAAIQVFVRFHRDTCTISIDTSGALLHRRGYKAHVTHAPIRETLAAAALRLCGFPMGPNLVDPMCGSGTFLMEAAMINSKTAPGLFRQFACERWPCMDDEIIEKERLRARRYVRPLTVRIAGLDRDPKAVASATHNATHAGFSDISVTQSSLSAATLPDGPGILVTNPPWGHRLPGKDLRDLYSRLGDLIRTRPDYHLCLLTAAPHLARATDIAFSFTSAPILLGGTHLKIYVAGVSK